MNNFFNKIGRFIVNLLVICLVLLISYQIIIKSDTATPGIRKIGDTIQNYLTRGEPETVRVIEEKENYIITIDLMQNYSLEEVWVLKNQQRVKNFSRGIVTINVQDGDYLSIDARGYKQALWFEITSASQEIKSLSEGKQYRANGNVIDIGIIEMDSKL